MAGASADNISRSAGKLDEAIHVCAHRNSLKISHSSPFVSGKEKKERLAPVIKEVRELRQQSLEIDRKYQDKKKQYDAMMMGMDTYELMIFLI